MLRTMQAPARITSARLGCKPDDLSALLGIARAVERDLPVDLHAVQDPCLERRPVVDGQAMLDRGEIRDGAAHADDALWKRAGRRAARGRPRSFPAWTPARPRRRPRPARTAPSDGPAPTFTLKRSATRGPWPNVNCELPPPVSKTTTEPSPRSELRHRSEIGEPSFFLAADHLYIDPRARRAQRR